MRRWIVGARLVELEYTSENSGIYGHGKAKSIEESERAARGTETSG